MTCEHLTRRVTRTDYDGTIAVLMDAYEGKPLNAPNDLTVHSDGSVWFTDPGWGIEGHYEGDKGVKEIPRYVFRIYAVTGEGVPVIAEMDRPNGICFCPTSRGSMWSILVKSGSSIWMGPLRSMGGYSLR